mmetsp:Transcript_125356/g.250213  ORF Transcript_125356/g.250213 Transcript_125356/m.250213 type:complete len:182 (+) Transcript_125356:62-607(+)
MERPCAFKLDCLQVDNDFKQDDVPTPRGNGSWLKDRRENQVETPMTHGAGKSIPPTEGCKSSRSSSTSTNPWQDPQASTWMRIRTPSPEMSYLSRTWGPIPLPVPNITDAVEVETVDEPVRPLPPSLGSFGHPGSCNKPCKYFWKTRGCKDGASCSHCHLCPRNHFIWRGRRGRKEPRSTD